MDEISKNIVEYFYSKKEQECPLLFCFIEKDAEHKDAISVQSAFTGEYVDGILFLSSLITNLGLCYKKDIKTVILDIAHDLESSQSCKSEHGNIHISPEGKVDSGNLEEAKPEKKRPNLEVVSTDDDDTD